MKKYIKSNYNDDDVLEDIVMYVNHKKIYEGSIYDLYYALWHWLEDYATDRDRQGFVDWCNSLGDPFYDERFGFPSDKEIADVVSDELLYEYESSNIPEDFYEDGDRYINMEVFPKSEEITSAIMSSANIEPKNEGILEVPEGKNVDDLPVSHFKKLIDKKGREAIIRALTNLEVWNKNDNKSLSSWAKGMKKSLDGYGEKE